MSCRKQKNRQTLCWIAQVAGKKKIYVFILAILQMTSGIVGVADALFLRNIIDAAVAENVQEFYQGILLFVGLILIEIILQLSSRFLEEYTKASLENNFKGRLFEALLYQEYSVVASFHSGEWMNRLTSDTVVVADGITQIIPGVMGMSVKIMGALTIIFYIEPRFTFVLIPGGLLLIFFTYRFRKITKQLHKRVQEADGKLRIFLQESLSNMIVVRSFSREEFFKEKSWEKMKEHKEKRLKTLQELAGKKAKIVEKTGKMITLEPMKAYERKIIHSFLQDNPNVETRSIGQEPKRRIVISKK